nr:GHKL domain-containing protein [uncultured Lachnoclostridium sp.]
MLSNLYLKRTVYKESPNTTLVLESVFLFWYILSSVLVLREKNKDIWKLKKKVDSGGNTKRQVRDIDQLRHDFSTNVFLMKNLLYYKDYDKLQHFMDTIFADVEKVRLVFDHPNFPVRIVISYLMQIAARAGIPFLIHIETNEFGMTDEDICIVLYNLVVYGLELASVISVREENVQLKVWHNQKGYAILCRCLCTKEEKLRQIDRRQEGSTIFGKELVVRIVKKYGGTMEIGSEKSKWKNIYVKNINIYIPCN